MPDAPIAALSLSKDLDFETWDIQARLKPFCSDSEGSERPRRMGRQATTLKRIQQKNNHERQADSPLQILVGECIGDDALVDETVL